MRDVIRRAFGRGANPTLVPLPEPQKPKDPTGVPKMNDVMPRSIEDQLILPKMQKFMELAVTGILSMAATLALVTSLTPGHHAGAKPIVTLDADRAAAAFVRSPGIADLDEQGFTEAVTKFHSALLKEMLTYGAKTGTVVMSSASVFAGDVPDVTDLLTQAAIVRAK